MFLYDVQKIEKKNQIVDSFVSFVRYIPFSTKKRLYFSMSQRDFGPKNADVQELYCVTSYIDDPCILFLILSSCGKEIIGSWRLINHTEVIARRLSRIEED